MIWGVKSAKSVAAVACFLSFCVLACGGGLRVAAAGDLRFVMPALVEAFRQESPDISIDLVYGASGTLYAQISNGAPYDVFLSADSEYPSLLMKNGYASSPAFQYARGKLAVCALRDSGIDIERLGIGAAATTEVRRIAIANPALAPYGRAAEAALKSAGLYEKVKPRLVNAENVSQAMQFVMSGNAQVGLVSKSLVYAAPTSATMIFAEIPAGLYPAIEQSAVVLKHSQWNAGAEQFAAFLQSPKAKEIFRRFGFETGE